MATISIIAAVDQNYGLGKDNRLLCYLPADLKYFKKMTMGKPVIMGRKTFLSIGKPLTGRQNIVLSQQVDLIEGADVVTSFEQAIAKSNNAAELMVIGGAEIFSQALPVADQIYLTLIHHTFEADVYFPEIDLSSWTCVSEVERPADEKNQYDLTFCHYKRK